MTRKKKKRRKYIRVPKHTRKVGKKRVAVRAHIRRLPSSKKKRKRR